VGVGFTAESDRPEIGSIAEGCEHDNVDSRSVLKPQPSKSRPPFAL
jgi:hypothetical protein